MLTEKALKAITSNETLKGRIATACNRSVYTIIRWVQDKDVMLTTAAVLQLIREETGMSDEEILIQEPASK